MKFKFIINKNANFYYFMHNMAKLNWPWRARTPLIQIWQKEIGALNKTEKDALNTLKTIHLKYINKKYLGKAFFLFKNPWDYFKKEISQSDLYDLKESFTTLENKFEKIYQLSNLKDWKRALDSELQKPERKTINKFIEAKSTKLFNVSCKKTVNVYLMMHCEYGIGGWRCGKYLDGKSIMLEPTQASILKQKMNQVLAFLWHETIQGCYSPLYFYPFLQKILKNENVVWWVEEIIIRSLTPTGIWGIKFFDYPLPSTLTNISFKSSKPRIDVKQTIAIINLIDQYIKENKKLDKKYVDKIISILKTNKKWATYITK